MGDKAKALVPHLAGAFAVFNSAFLCSRSHREKSKCSQIAVRLTSKAGDRPPYGQKDANFGLDPVEGWGLFFTQCVVPEFNAVNLVA
jgi:hypothetical protein